MKSGGLPERLLSKPALEHRHSASVPSGHVVGWGLDSGFQTRCVHGSQAYVPFPDNVARRAKCGMLAASNESL
jgi:AICAR transformylase/IMP cyclohydrolase PurH